MTAPLEWKLVPVEPTDAEIEAGCRAMHEAQGTGEADAPLHSPYQNSWDEPDTVRWKQWDETVRAVREAMLRAALASPLPEEAAVAPKGVSVGVREALEAAQNWISDNIREGDIEGCTILGSLAALTTQEATPAGDMADLIARPERVRAAFEVWRSHPETGPNASALFEHIEALEASLASLSARLVEVERENAALGELPRGNITRSMYLRERELREAAEAKLADAGDEREACAQIAEAIDSGRGNEAEIARAIRARTVHAWEAQ